MPLLNDKRSPYQRTVYPTTSKAQETYLRMLAEGKSKYGGNSYSPAAFLFSGESDATAQVDAQIALKKAMNEQARAAAIKAKQDTYANAAASMQSGTQTINANALENRRRLAAMAGARGNGYGQGANQSYQRADMDQEAEIAKLAAQRAAYEGQADTAAQAAFTNVDNANFALDASRLGAISEIKRQLEDSAYSRYIANEQLRQAAAASANTVNPYDEMLLNYYGSVAGTESQLELTREAERQAKAQAVKDYLYSMVGDSSFDADRYTSYMRSQGLNPADSTYYNILGPGLKEDLIDLWNPKPKSSSAWSRATSRAYTSPGTPYWNMTNAPSTESTWDRILRYLSTAGGYGGGLV